MKAGLKILISFAIVFSFFGCKKDTTAVSNIPFIELKEFSQQTTGLEKEIKISISFTDGDGDFGLSDNQSVVKIDTIMQVCTDAGLVSQSTKFTKSINSLFATIKEKKNGSFITAYITNTYKTKCQVITDTVTLNQTLPLVEPRGSNKTLKGTIQTQFLIPVEEAQVKRGTIRLEIYIEDRAKNKSNVIITPEFIF